MRSQGSARDSPGGRTFWDGVIICTRRLLSNFLSTLNGAHREFGALLSRTLCGLSTLLIVNDFFFKKYIKTIHFLPSVFSRGAYLISHGAAEALNSREQRVNEDRLWRKISGWVCYRSRFGFGPSLITKL